ncbi:MAG: DJ-1/PfpI family protein [Pontiellaceae bacterium]|nr:DJ-1/PfpI family protein [Pontiellaceae bacterium]
MKALLPIADGSEEMEAVILIDTLRRARWEVVVAGLSAGPITASRGVKLVPDAAWEQINPADFDILILPGGTGGTNVLMKHAGVQQALRDFHADGKWIAAVCAAPRALNEAGLLEGRRFTCYPGVEETMPQLTRSDDSVVVDGRLITSQGPGTSFEFALRIIAECDRPAVSDEVRRGLLL